MRRSGMWSFGRLRRWPVRFLPAVAAVSLCGTAEAGSGHWISVGAFRASEAAEQLATDASVQSGLRFEVVSAEVHRKGALQRVLAGPYSSREDADADLAAVRRQGFGDAWVLEVAVAPAPRAPAGASPSTSAARPPLVIGAPRFLWSIMMAGQATDVPAPADGGEELPSIEFLLQGWPDAPTQLPSRQDEAGAVAPVGEAAQAVETAPTAEAEPALATVGAPDGFQLHKLHRAGARNALRSAPFNGFDGFDMRLKWYTVAQSLPAGDVLREVTGERLPLSHNADMRLMWRREIGALRLHVDHSTTWLRSDVAAGSPGLTLDQTPMGDDRRLMNLTWEVGAGSHGQALHRFDRFALEYRGANWTVAAGRQAVSWGGGLVFQPMDLFNPFAPTTVDQDYKAGDDMLRFERLFADGADLQVLLVGRRSAAGDPSRHASSLAAKYRGHFGDNEVEFMASQHYGGQVYGVGLRIPAGGALVRSDITWTVEDGRATISGLVNADYSFTLAGTIVHVFGEYFHNGFGVQRLPDDLRLLPAPLLARIGRGELFNLMRDYLALGTSFRWHFLLNQSFAVIANLHDASFAAQLALTYDTSDASRLQVGLTMPFGTRGDEFGGVTVGDGLTIGGGEQGFVRFVYFF